MFFMKDDGARLSYVIDGCSYRILDNISGKYCFSFEGHSPIVTLDKQVAIDHIETIITLLAMTPKRVKGSFKYKKTNKDASLSIVEVSHYYYTIKVGDVTGTLTEHDFTAPKQLDVPSILRKLNYVWSCLMQLQNALTPTRDIVRRIADVGVLVWVYEGNSIVCYENNICGSIMLNCMVNGEHYKQIFVSLNKEKNQCDLFDNNLNLICEFPIDDSILSYYSYDADAFSEGD